MKIVLATPIYPPEIGGPAIYSQKLKEGLEREGNAVKVVSYPGLKKYPQPIRIFLYFLALFKNAKGCDLIYAFNLTSCGLPARLVGKILRKKFLIRVGGDFLWERAVEAGRTRKPLREYYQDPKTLKEKFWIRLMKKVFSQADKIIFTSDFQQGIYLGYFNIKKEKTTIVPNPFPEFNSSTDDISSIRHQILYAGRLIKLKNLDRLIDAFGGVLSKIDKPLTLKIIGEGPEKTRLESKIKDLGLVDKITIEKPLSQPDLWQEIRQSYLCVLPSLTEITPNFALECIKLGKPILLTGETALYHDLKDSLIFLDPQNSLDLEEKILYLLDGVNYAAYLERIKNIPVAWSWAQVVDEHLKLFKSLV